MRMAKGTRLALLLALPWTVDAQDAPRIREFEPAVVEELGRALYRYDNLSAVATDLMLARFPRPEEQRITGWITSEDDSGPLVSFITVQGGQFVSAIDVRPERGGAEAITLAGGRALTENELTRHIARLTASRQLGEICSDRYNHVVLDDPERDGWLVYFLAASSEVGTIPVGGHYRMSVSADGTEVLQADKLFNSCLLISPDGEPRPDDAEIAGLYVTHLVSDSPIETHSYLSLAYGLNLAVMTPGSDTLWQVAQGRIAVAEIGVSSADPP